MKFVTLSQKQVTQSSDYTGIKDNHLLISIRNPHQSLQLPASPYCKGTLVLNFEDFEDFNEDRVCFDVGMAKEILKFVDTHCHKVNTIVCHCWAGASRSVAVNSALSKILNNKDDDVWSHGVANSLVYVTILDTYFSDPQYNKTWPAMFYLRKKAMKMSLSPVMYKIGELKLQERNKLKEE